jgi:hypothetical protein
LTIKSDNNGKVYAIVITGIDYATYNGFSIGDTKEKIYEIFHGNTLESKDWISCDLAGGSWVMQFHILDNKVIEIYIGPGD